jgi:hypothetical protein
MAYTKTTWVDCQTPAVNATNLNKIETGIGDLHTTLANVSLNSGEIRIGGSSDYLAVEADGTIEFNGEATVWDDLRIIPGQFDRPGTSDPTLVPYTPGGSGTAMALYEFAKGDTATFTVQLPHSYKHGSSIYVHVHWTPGGRGVAESGATVGWKLDYSWANVNGAFGTMAVADMSDACDGTDHKHQMSPDAVISGTGKTISSMILCNIKRTDSGADDTWASTTSGQLPMLLEIDFHFEIDTVGSRERASK